MGNCIPKKKIMDKTIKKEHYNTCEPAVDTPRISYSEAGALDFDPCLPDTACF